MTSFVQAGETAGQGAPLGQVFFRLEPGEMVMWQGRPSSSALLRHLLKVRWLAAYFTGLLCWKFALIVGIRGLHPQEVVEIATLAVQAAALLGIAAYFAWALARNTTYAVTDRRIVIRHGIALPGTIDIPLRALREVAVRIYGDGTGDVALGVREGGGIGYAKLWPHVRGLGISRSVPLLRGLADAVALSAMLSRHLNHLHGAGVVLAPIGDVTAVRAA